MKKIILPFLLLPVMLAAQSAPDAATAASNASSASAEVKVGTAVENHAVVGASDSFTVAAGTKLYAWAQLAGMAEGSTVSVVWKKGGTEVQRYDLNVPRARYRTQAFKTFRAGDSGDWTVHYMQTDTEIGSASFKVEISQ